MLSSKNCTRLAGSVRSKRSSTQLCFSPTPRSPRVKYCTWTAARTRANGDGEQHRCKKGRALRLRWCSPWICRSQRNPGARVQGRVTPTIQPYNSADHLPCDAIWGGNRNAYRDIRTYGLTVSVYSSASNAPKAAICATWHGRSGIQNRRGVRDETALGCSRNLPG